MSIETKLNTIIANNETLKGHVEDSLLAVADKGVSVPEGSKAEDLPTLIEGIETGTSETPYSIFYLHKLTLTKDSGVLHEKIPIKGGDVIDLGDGQDVEASSGRDDGVYFELSHPEMIFQQWNGSVTITDNQFIIPDIIYTDFVVVALYKTADDLHHLIRWIPDEGYVDESAYNISDLMASYTDTSKNNIVAFWGRSGQDVSNYIYICYSLIVCTSSTNGSYASRQCTNMKYWFSFISAVSYSMTGSSSITCAHLLPNSTTLNPNVVTSCSRLESIYLPPLIASIGTSAFSGCTALKQANIPPLVTSIGDTAFNNCYALKTVVFEGETPPTVGTTILNNALYAVILVPEGSVDAYKETTNLAEYDDRIFANTHENRIKYGLEDAD